MLFIRYLSVAKNIIVSGYKYFESKIVSQG